MRARHSAPPQTTVRSGRVKAAVAAVIAAVTAIVVTVVTTEGAVEAVRPHS
jgi:hypothetical protein